MKGISRREGQRGNKNKKNRHDDDDDAHFEEREHAGKKKDSSKNHDNQRAPKHGQHGNHQNNNNSAAPSKPYVPQLHGESAPQHQKGQVNARSKDPRDVAALKALAAQRNRKGGRSALVGGPGGIPRSAAIAGNSDALLTNFKSRLSGSTFRLMNEQLYTTPSDFAKQLLGNESAFKEYHDGYNRQLQLWPVNPVDIVIDSLKFSKKGRFDSAFHNMKTKPDQSKNNTANTTNNQTPKWIGVPSNIVIADFGCGSAHLAKVLKNRFKLSNTIHSFDLSSANDPEFVTACNMTEVPLEDDTVDIALFSLSLMSTNWTEYLREAHRVLKKGEQQESSNNHNQHHQQQQNANDQFTATSGGGILKIIEVRSRMPDPDKFAQVVESLGFKFLWGDVVGEGYFCAFDFEAVNKSGKRDIYAERSLPEPSDVLTPCLYKRR